ncbi:MAG: N-acetylneuraminate synthase family protein [Phycisphaerales bacterium]|nr:N-acetylneuraminate synthase family protein [Phycisphaerales bacterium]
MMETLGVILARAGSKGLPGKCLRRLLGRPLIDYTFDHALASRRLDGIVFTSDCEPAKLRARQRGIEVVDRPAELATDSARVDDAARHAVEVWERRHARRANQVVLLYGNIPVRSETAIDHAISLLLETGADSVRTVAPVGKMHPDWLHRLEGDRMRQFRPNSIYRRQDLEPLYCHDGAVVAVTRRALFDLALRSPDDAHAFLGEDRRALLQNAGDAVDVDEPGDLYAAEAALRARGYSPAPLPAANATEDARAASVRLATADPLNTIRRTTYVIAEAGVNHDGRLDNALTLIDAASDAGANAVKFQMFRADDLSTADAAQAAYQQACAPAGSQRRMLSGLELRDEAWPALIRRCHERGIDFLATPFGPAEVERLAALGAKAIKIASTDLTNPRLIDAALATALPVILSTGASLEAEIDNAIERFRQAGALERLTLMHCVSCYPTPVERANLRRIVALRDRYGVPTGFSDHTLSVWTGSWATALGAGVIEKHLTLDRSAGGPDHAMSLCPEKLREYVARIREVETALGTGGIDMHETEQDVRRIGRRSIVAARDLPAGAVLTASALALKRPGTGLPADALETLTHRRLRVAVSADTVLTWDMVE